VIIVLVVIVVVVEVVMVIVVVVVVVVIVRRLVWKRMYMVVSLERNAGQSHKITICNKPFETVEHFEHSRRTLTYLNCIPEETKN
jgi:hypothetical protein